MLCTCTTEPGLRSRIVTGTPATHAAPAATVTVRDLLDVPSLGLTLLSAPEAIDAMVRWAHPTELLDPRPYLSGDELVLTVGTTLAGDDDRCRLFLGRLVEAGVSAVGYGVGDVTEDVPHGLLEACRRAGVPLLRVPEGVPFQAITELLADRRAEARATEERRVQRLSTRLLDAMAADCPLEQLLEVVAADLGGQVDFEHGVLRWTAVSEDDVVPSESTVHHIGSVLAVRQHEEDVSLAHQRAEAGRLLRLVIDGKADPEVLLAALADAGLGTDQPLVVTAWPDRASSLVVEGLGEALFADLAQHSVSITADTDRVLASAVNAKVPCGVAAPCDVAKLASAVPVALAALDLSRRRGVPATYRHLVTLEGLLEQQPRDRMQPFVDTLLLPLLEHDRTRGTALVETLREFRKNDGSITTTAQNLHLHPNSLRHRLKRIGELTGADPKIFSDRVALAVALWAWDRRPYGHR